MIKVAFASSDRTHVDLHFGAAETFVLYDVGPDSAELLGVGQFARREMRGQLKDYAVPELSPDDPNYLGEPVIPEDPQEREDKVTAKLEFLQECAAVYAVAIGNSSLKRLMGAGIQPVIARNGQDIESLLREIAAALDHGGMSWVVRAANRAQTRRPDRFAAMAREPWVEDESWQARA
ncbi:vanadium nitrogenase [Parasulfuritortus cantonensis]|uniref:Vanadium nitrogenase n=1 Tax=Parasulfuritortus cantonensis TaxID=2528202 RepID=A0A4R1BD33_9PROT|nr:NifB/NifX family molybdenum-iron cluster-binding protein [Parasulfuritortus cantonensis]TCJ14917.1 vanadium nitrogenase [Parasulfuritortus cantonensis]